MNLLNRLKTIGQPKSLIDNYDISIDLASDVGCCRTNNEDSIHYFSLDDYQQNILAIVADGMGGHAAGEIASKEAINSIQSYYFAKKFIHQPMRSLKNAFTQANAHIYELATHDTALSGMGTTATALAISNSLAYYAHVGDSRLYLIRDNKMRQLSRDHTLVANMVNDGLISEDMARTHPDRHIITRALGTRAFVEIDIIKSPLPIQLGDIFILCSDGLHDLITESEISEIVLNNTPSKVCDLLIQAARLAGGFDNISVIILLIQTKQLQPVKVAITKV